MLSYTKSSLSHAAPPVCSLFSSSSGKEHTLDILSISVVLQYRRDVHVAEVAIASQGTRRLEIPRRLLQGQLNGYIVQEAREGRVAHSI